MNVKQKSANHIVTGLIGGLTMSLCIFAVVSIRASAKKASTRFDRQDDDVKACQKTVFPAEVLRVIDGDTFKARLDQGLGTFRVTDVRLAGIDTPEVHGPIVKRDPVRGPLATEFTKAWLKRHHNQVELVVKGDDKYGGRIDASVYPIGGGQSLSDALRDGGHEK